MNNIISLSGGQDSTAMLLLMIERKKPIHSIVFFDTGWEFPEMLKHIDLLEKHIGIKIWRLHPKKSFDYYLLKHSFQPRNKKIKKRIGYGWPNMFRRWCTRIKIDSINYFCKSIPFQIQYIGYSLNEKKRIKIDSKIPKRYPLIEWNITEADALQYCYDKGYDWGGLYKHFKRVSCFCCPLQRIGELKKLRKHFPNLWRQMLKMDKAILVNKGFRDYDTIHDLEKRFAKEDQIEKRIINFLL